MSLNFSLATEFNWRSQISRIRVVRAKIMVARIIIFMHMLVVVQQSFFGGLGGGGGRFFGIAGGITIVGSFLISFYLYSS